MYLLVLICYIDLLGLEWVISVYGFFVLDWVGVEIFFVFIDMIGGVIIYYDFEIGDLMIFDSSNRIDCCF